MRLRSLPSTPTTSTGTFSAPVITSRTATTPGTSSARLAISSRSWIGAVQTISVCSW